MPDPSPTEPRNRIGSVSSWALVVISLLGTCSQCQTTARHETELKAMRESLSAMKTKIDNAVREPKRPPPKEAK